ncbi:hypothetical protein NMY22_g7129 [Coprinellus aureogranulatus]|nr:hypothetical protein NMY22_g7129 [Coprinellus aureogranulatus]
MPCKASATTQVTFVSWCGDDVKVVSFRVGFAILHPSWRSPSRFIASNASTTAVVSLRGGLRSSGPHSTMFMSPRMTSTLEVRLLAHTSLMSDQNYLSPETTPPPRILIDAILSAALDFFQFGRLFARSPIAWIIVDVCAVVVCTTSPVSPGSAPGG